jgi:hypothetical protein
MGQQAKARRGRREARQKEARDMVARYAELQERPDIQAHHAEQAADEERQARVAADRPVQYSRLRAAGWKQRAANLDGVGTWDRRGTRLIHSVSREDDDQLWVHVSLSLRDGTLPGWYELRNAQWLIYPGQYGLVVVAPQDRHVNISEVAHVWTCLTADVLPDFGRYGTI